jgi:DNA-binding IclR family transcriptional regulator
MARRQTDTDRAPPKRAEKIRGADTAPEADVGDLAAMSSLRKALALLDAVAKAERPLTVAEAAAIARVARPTAYRLVQELVAEDHLSHDSYGRLRIGFAVIPMAAKVLDSTRTRAEAMPHLYELRRKTGQRVNLGLFHRNRILMIAGVEKPSLPVLYARFGRSLPLHCSAMGKAILAAQSEQDVKQLVKPDDLKAFTPNTITSYPKLLKEIEEVRKRGYAVNNGERALGTCCVAAVIYDVLGKADAAVSLSGRDLSVLTAEAEAVRYTAEVVSHCLERESIQ